VCCNSLVGCVPGDSKLVCCNSLVGCVPGGSKLVCCKWQPSGTNPSYDQNLLKKISIQTTIKVLLKFHFEMLRVCVVLKKLCSYHCATERLLTCIPSDLLEGVYSTPFRIFDLRPCVQNVRILLVRLGVPVSSLV
jgi:hypothetical protein